MPVVKVLVKVLQGQMGMAALMRAFFVADDVFELVVTTGVTTEDGSRLLLFTIEQTTAAMTIGEAGWLSDMLIEQSRTPELVRFGRLLQTALAEAPGPHQGLH